MSSETRVRYEFSLDTPLPVRATEGVVRLKGWCFTAHAESTPEIQLRVGDVVLRVPTGETRPDVAAAFSAVPHAASSGFSLAGHIPAGLSTASLWAGRDGCGWEQLLAFSIYSEAAVLHGAIDLPLDKLITTNRSIDGWCFHPQREIAELWLHYGTRQVKCRHYGHPRNDVAAQFPHLPQARACGFSSDDVLVPGEGPIRLKAIDREGGIYFCATDHKIALAPADPYQRHSDPRLDGRALYRAISGRQHELPELRILLTDPSVEQARAALGELTTLPGDRWQLLLAASAAPPPSELKELVETNSRTQLVTDFSRIPRAWTLLLSPGDTPDIHGVMAGWLAAAEHPELAAIYGDVAVGPERLPAIQPAWSPTLFLDGVIDPTSPVLHAPGKFFPESPLATLARTRDSVAHVSACFSQRRAGSPSPAPSSDHEFPCSQPAPALTAIFAGDEASLATAQTAFGNEIQQWLLVPESAPPARYAAALEQAANEQVIFLSANCQARTLTSIRHLAQLAAAHPSAAVAPLLLRPDFAPWTANDIFAPRTRQTLASFDPSYAGWADPALALFARELAYVAFPGLTVNVARARELQLFASGTDTVTGSLIEFALRLRRARTPAILVSSLRLVAPPRPATLTAFEETLLLDRWDQDDANPLRIRPLVQVEVLA